MARPKAIVPVSSEGYVNWMLYGPPGVGKSSLIGQSPKALILANNPSETVSMRGSDAQMWHIKTLLEATEAYEYLRHEGHKEFDWVWVDNASLFQDQNMDDIMETVHAAKPHRSLWVPDKQEYLQNQNQLAMFVRNMIDLPMNVGFTAHTMPLWLDEGEEVPTSTPMFQGGRGALSQKLCGYMNLVTYMDTRRTKKLGKQRYLITEQSAKFYAKDRFGVLPARVYDPTIPQIMELIESAGGGSKRKASRRPATKRKRTTTRRAS